MVPQLYDVRVLHIIAQSLYGDHQIYSYKIQTF